MKTVLYVRTSTKDKQDPKMQENELRAFAKLKGLNVTKVYNDHGFSGSKMRRPALTELFKDAEMNQFDTVLVWKFDRFSRSLKELIMMIDRLNSKNISFISLKDGVDLTTSVGKFQMQILGAVAEFEREMIRERVQAGMDRIKETGETRTGNPVGSPRVVNRQAIFDLKAKGKLSNYGIAKKLKISKSTVYRILNGYDH